MSQIKSLLDVIADIRSLGDSLETLAQALTVNEVGNLDDYEEIYNPEKDESSAAPEPVTFVQLRSRLAEISRDGHTNEVKLLITKYGSNKLSDVPENKYAELLAEAEKL